MKKKFEIKSIAVAPNSVTMLACTYDALVDDRDNARTFMQELGSDAHFCAMITVGLNAGHIMERLQSNMVIGDVTRTHVSIALTAFFGNEAEDAFKITLSAFQANRSQRVGVVFESPKAFLYFAQNISRYVSGYKLNEAHMLELTQNSVLCFSKDKVTLACER